MSAAIPRTFPATQPTYPQSTGSSGSSAQEVPLQANHPEQEAELTPDRPPQSVEDSQKKRPRGFAAMDRRLVSEIARKGGKAAHSAGTAHEFSSEEARAAGQKGGRATHARRQRGADVNTHQGETKPGE